MLLIYVRLESSLVQGKNTVEVNPIEIICVSLYLPVLTSLKVHVKLRKPSRILVYISNLVGLRQMTHIQDQRYASEQSKNKL